ncbi:MAG TPA: hypothetical protein VG871_13870, partial [Vicinamibacterales bacterium]|nr:hypothetical protein [Vicinamibacterales bacterium]
MTVSTAVQERDRAKVPERYKWNLADLYADDAAWREAKTRVAAEVPAIRQYRGRLGESAATLAEALALVSRVDQAITRLYVYASMRSDEDTRVSETQGMQQEMQQLYSEFGAEASFIEPEILGLGQARLEQFLAAEPRLADHAFHLRDALRRAPHTLSDAEEKILADAGPLAGSPSNIFGVLANADF